MCLCVWLSSSFYFSISILIFDRKTIDKGKQIWFFFVFFFIRKNVKKRRKAERIQNPLKNWKKKKKKKEKMEMLTRRLIFRKWILLFLIEFHIMFGRVENENIPLNGRFYCSFLNFFDSPFFSFNSISFGVLLIKKLYSATYVLLRRIFIFSLNVSCKTTFSKSMEYQEEIKWKSYWHFWNFELICNTIPSWLATNPST